MANSKSVSKIIKFLDFMPKISIIVLNWNSKQDTLDCLASLKHINYKIFNIIVVDNGSSDNSATEIRNTFSEVIILETGHNLGYAGGNNVGIKYALNLDVDYILLLNNDTTVDPEILNSFISAAQRNLKVGAFGARIYYHGEPKRIWWAGAKWSPDQMRFLQIGEGEIDDDRIYGNECITDYACGCAMFIPAERFREVGLLDEDFFLYFEESDWCYRARKAGYLSYYVPNAKLWHKVSVSFGGENSPLATYFITRNRLLWAKKHLPQFSRFLVYANSLMVLIGKFSVIFSLAQLKLLKTPQKWWWSTRQIALDPNNNAYLFGVRDFFMNRFGNCPDVIRSFNTTWVKTRTP